MIERIGCLGLSHHHAPVVVRESLCLTPEAKGRLYVRAATLPGFALLSTCNRLEFYVERAQDDERTLIAAVRDLLPPSHGQHLPKVQSYMYEYLGSQAVQHLASVAAGLDSMVVGEPQIQGQVQECLRDSESYACASPLLADVFYAALKAGGRVRQETALSRHPVSVISAGINMAQELLGTLEGRRITVIGAGDMGSKAAKILSKVGAERLAIVNRTEEYAFELAARVGAEAYPLDALSDVLYATDVVFCVARPQDLIVTLHHLQGRPGPLLVMDLAVPRSVDPAVERLPGIRLRDIDSLKSIMKASMALRRAEVPKAEAIVDEEVSALEDRLRVQSVEPVIRHLRLKAESIRKQELARALKGIKGIKGKAQEDVEHLLRTFSRTLVNKILHEPTKQLRVHASHDDAKAATELIEALFAL